MPNTPREHPERELPGGLVSVPNASLTTVTTVDTYISQIVVSNTTAAAVTLTVQDSSAKALLAAVSLAANSQQTFSYPDLVLMSGGYKWQASATGLVAEVFGYRHE